MKYYIESIPMFNPIPFFILMFLIESEAEFNEFKPRLKSPINRFQFSAGLNLEKLSTILSWNQPYLSPGLNLSPGSNSLNSVSVDPPSSTGIFKRDMSIHTGTIVSFI